MTQDIIKTFGTLKSSNPGAGGANTKNYPMFGIVKDNIDPTRSGRIKVLLGDKSPKDSDNSDSWITVSYLSNFFGKVESTATTDGLGTYKTNSSSYGEWHAPPDIGTKVICIFVNGDPNYGFYVGCVPEAESLHMVPAIGSSDNIVANEGEAKSYGGAVRLPVTNINTNNTEVSNSPQFNDAPRPIHSYTAAVMNQQGILRDPIRGPISSSASREPASRVGWGVSTPGRPIYEGGFDDSTITQNLDSSKHQQLKVVARRGGHSFVMDDGDIIGRDQVVRIRTALGHQILMSDDGQTLMILHSNGQSYIELGKEGTIDMYSTNSVNIRTHGDLNLHADRNVNINAGEKLNIQAKTIHTNSEDVTQMRSGSDIKLSASGKLTGLATGPIAWSAGGDASIVSSGQSYINGSKVNLNSGAPSTTPEAVSSIPIIAQTDTLYDKEKGFMASPGKLLTIVSRAPAHAPWANAGQGIDIKTNLGASSQLPPDPSPEVSAVTEAAAQTAPVPPAIATVASVPSVPSVSTAMDKNTTNAVLGAIATNAATSPLSPATKQGAAIVETSQGPVVAIGAFAQTATQLSTGGVLKPGADILINGLIQQGKTISEAMPTSLFTGLPGAYDLPSLIKNTTAQANSVVNNLQRAQSALSSSGVLTGKESSTVVAGLVTSAATVGLSSTVAAVTQTLGNTTRLINVSGLPEAINQTTNAINAIGRGGISAALAINVAGGLGGITNALNAMDGTRNLNNLLDQVKGVAGSAFAAIKNSFKPLKPGVPQNLTAIAKENAITATKNQETSTDTLKNVVIGDDAIIGATAAIHDKTGANGYVTGALSTLTSTSGSINNSVAGITGELINAEKGTTFENSMVTTIDSITTISIPSSVSTNNNPSKNGIEHAANTISAIAGAGSIISRGGIEALTSAAASIQTGASASVSSSIASGMSGLPGGVNIAATVINNAPTAINNIPGTASISKLIKDTQTAAMNGLPSEVIGSLENTKNLLGGLTSVASSGLPASAIAKLQSSIASLSSGGATSVSLPTLGFNTNNREEITSQTKIVIGDPAIPPPNLTGSVDVGVSAAYQMQTENLNSKITAAKTKADASRAAFEKIKKQFNALSDEQLNIKNNYPAGSKEIVSIQEKSNDFYNNTYLVAKKMADEDLLAYINLTTI